MEDRGGDGYGVDGERDQYQGSQDHRSQDQQPQDQQPQGQQPQGRQPQGMPQMQPQLVQPMFVPYMPPPPKRSKAPLVFTGVGGLVLGLLIGYGAGQGSKTTTASDAVITTTTSAPSSAPAAATPAAHSSAGSSASTSPATSAAPAAPAKIGGTISLTGMRGDEKLAVTLVKVADPAKGADEFSGPSDGKRWVAVQIRITNTATTAYSDSPTNGAKLVDTQGQRYSVTFGDTTLGQAMDSGVKLAPGDSALGVILFEVPTGQKLATFQFALDSGFADQTGQWQLS